ncbi:MAG: endonuclease domain-containing protein [Ruminococcaceae bacterium]|nr:endonuclease domain-containing protein [Oscillospiraceae bacterium]
MEEVLISCRRAQELRKNMTKEERHLWYDFLKTYPVQFRRQYQIGYYYVDFFCYKAKLIVELDGSQHCSPEVLAYDKARTDFLQEQGFFVQRFSNLDVMKNFQAVCEAIHQTVEERMQG